MNVFITGIHTGLGRALAARCLEDGSRVYAVSRAAPGDLADHHGLQFRSLDLHRLDRIPDTLAGLLEGAGRLDAVILNAGVLGGIKDLRRYTVDELRAVMDVNVWANKVVIDTLLALGIPVAQVVGMSSGASLNGSGGWGAYAVSKSALNLLLRVYAHEHPDTHFTALAPGLVETAMTHEVAAAPDDPRHPASARVGDAIREGHAMQPDEAAANVLRCLPVLLDHPSGAYVDIRKLGDD